MPNGMKKPSVKGPGAAVRPGALMGNNPMMSPPGGTGMPGMNRGGMMGNKSARSKSGTVERPDPGYKSGGKVKRKK